MGTRDWTVKDAPDPGFSQPAEPAITANRARETDPSGPFRKPAVGQPSWSVLPPLSQAAAFILLVFAAAALSLTAMLAWAAWETDRQRSENAFTHAAARTITEISQTIQKHALLAQQLGWLMANGGEQRLAEFEQLAGQALLELSGLKFAAWIQPDPAAMASTEPMAAFQAGLDSFRLVAWWEAGRQAAPPPPGARPSVAYAKQPAFIRAILNGETTVSESTVLFRQDQEPPAPGATFSHPVYTNPAKNTLDGVVQLGVRLDRILPTDLADNPFTIHVFDTTSGPATLLYAGSSAANNTQAGSLTPQDLARGIHLSQVLGVANRQWSIWLSPGDQYAWSHSQAGWLTLFFGILLTLILTALASRWQRRLQHSRFLLAERSRHLTDALRRVNQLEFGSRELFNAAADAEDRFRRLSEASGDMMFKVAMNGKILFVSPNCQDSLGFSAEEILRLPPFGLYAPGYQEQIQQVRTKNKADAGDHFMVNCPLMHRNGKTVWVESNHWLRRDDQGNPDHLLIMARDISERFAISEGLLESEQLFRSAFNNAALAMALCNPEGRFTHVNQALCAKLGYGCSELLEMSLQNITHPADLKETEDSVRAMLSEQRDTCSLKKRYLRKNGEVIWSLLQASMVRNSTGEAIHLCVQILDAQEPKA